MGVHDDEAADKGSKERTREYGHREDGDSEAAGAVVKHVREDGSDYGEGAGAEETAEEAAKEDGLEIFACSGADLEDGEAEHPKEDGEFSAAQFGERSP